MEMLYSMYLFDVGGTLITFDEAKRAEAYAERAATVGVTVSAGGAQTVLEALNLEIPDRSKHVQLSLMPAAEARAFWVDLWAEGFRRLGVDEPKATAFADELLDPVNGGDYQTVFNDVVPALEALRGQGKRLGIISNFSPNCEALLRTAGLADYFDFFIVSGILGIEKPDPRIFEAAVTLANMPRADLVYIGDSVFHDIEGARGAGMAAILIDRANRFPDFSGARVTDLRQLVDSSR